jgi:hypothetical protein
MLFGDPSDFAIEADVEPDLRPPSAVWGCMCVWCRGNALGRLEERYCALYHSHCSFEWVAAHLDELWTPELAAFGDDGKWNFLHGLLYGYHGDIDLGEHDRRTLAEMRLDWAEYGRFDFLTNWGEQFDGGFASFLFRPPGQDVCILSRAFPPNVGLCVRVTPGGFVAAATGFVEWFREQERRLQTNG